MREQQVSKHAMTSQIRSLTRFASARKRTTWRRNLKNLRTLTNDFSFTKMIWTEILREEFIEGIIAQLVFTVEFPFKHLRCKLFG